MVNVKLLYLNRIERFFFLLLLLIKTLRHVKNHVYCMQIRCHLQDYRPRGSYPRKTNKLTDV